MQTRKLFDFTYYSYIYLPLDPKTLGGCESLVPRDFKESYSAAIYPESIVRHPGHSIVVEVIGSQISLIDDMAEVFDSQKVHYSRDLSQARSRTRG